ncbi:MAG: hypothetical protein JSV49_09850 [Thermoplasmata archaeon]|nr:MAG: hypothetical protein JSV49_09850 [Thermoplasmata archaeon]
MLVGTCYICSSPAMFTCVVCGRTVCIQCYDKPSRLCTSCLQKLRPGRADRSTPYPPTQFASDEGDEGVDEDFEDDEEP